MGAGPFEAVVRLPHARVCDEQRDEHIARGESLDDLEPVVTVDEEVDEHDIRPDTRRRVAT